VAAVRLITFDLDDTLWAGDTVIAEAERRLRGWLAEHAPGALERFDPDTMRALRAELLADAPELEHDVGALRLRLLERALERSGYAPTRACDLARDAFEAFIAARHEVELFPDALETLAALSSRYLLGALSNGNADIARIGIDRHFAFHLSAADVGRKKPHPAMFEAALERAGTQPEETLHVGDHLEDDVSGAAGAGILPVWLNRGGIPKPGGLPEHIEILTLADLPRLLADLDRA